LIVSDATLLCAKIYCCYQLLLISELHRN
jgi:hypothetical protein